jgi:tRNA 2-thiouridine synthesizing protein A
MSTASVRPQWAKADATVDVRGESCPIPEMTVSKKLKALPSSKVLEVITDHQAAVDVTLPDLARELGYAFYSERSGDAYLVYIAKS